MWKKLAILILLGWNPVPGGFAAAQTQQPSGAPPNVTATVPGAGGYAEEPPAPRPANYALSAGDVVTIKVFREPDLDSIQRISKDGTINFPLLGVIKIAGKTTNEAAAQVASLLDHDYVHHPQVTVSIATYNKVRFTVLGQVNNPGSYEIPDETSVDLLFAIARAGGFSRLAQPRKVVVRRMVNGREDTFNVDVEKMMKDSSVNRFVILSNDTISVPERFF